MVRFLPRYHIRRRQTDRLGGHVGAGQTVSFSRGGAYVRSDARLPFPRFSIAKRQEVGTCREQRWFSSGLVFFSALDAVHTRSRTINLGVVLVVASCLVVLGGCRATSVPVSTEPSFVLK